MNRFSSIFSQLLQLFPRVEFQHLVTVTQAERHAKGFPVGANLCPCSFANWAQPILCVRLPEVFEAVREAETFGHDGSEPFHLGLCQ